MEMINCKCPGCGAAGELEEDPKWAHCEECHIDFNLETGEAKGGKMALQALERKKQNRRDRERRNGETVTT